MSGIADILWCEYDILWCVSVVVCFSVGFCGVFQWEKLIFCGVFQWEKLIFCGVFQWEKLMADLGGLLGLFVGISALSVMELFELIVDVCFLVPFHRYINRNRVSLASPNREETKDSSTRLK